MGFPLAEGIAAALILSSVGANCSKRAPIPSKSCPTLKKTKRLSSDDMAVTRAHGERLAAEARHIGESIGHGFTRVSTGF